MGDEEGAVNMLGDEENSCLIVASTLSCSLVQLSFHLESPLSESVRGFMSSEKPLMNWW